MSVGQVLRVARVAPFAVVMVAPILASGFGLVSVGHGWLGLDSWAALLVPLTLDAAALSFALLSWKATLDDDAAGVDRCFVWLFAGISAGLNIWFADAVGGLHRAVFYGTASMTAALVWERLLRAARRRELRALGRVDKPAPRFRFLRWLLFPVETAGAFRFAVGEGISDPRTAIARYRHRNAPEPEANDVPAADRTDAPRPHEPTFTQKPESPKPARSAANPARGEAAAAAAVSEVAPELAGLSHRCAVEKAIESIGSYDAKAAREWLAARGVVVDKSGSCRIVRELRAAAETAEQDTSPRLSVVTK